MRLVILTALLVAAPAAACDMDGMFGFNHYAQMANDAAAAEAMREAAIAEARDKFRARFGMPAVAEAVASAPVQTAAAAPAAVPAAGSPQ